MKDVKIPEQLVEQTHEVLDELEEAVLGEKIEARRFGKTGVRAGASGRALYGVPTPP